MEKEKKLKGLFVLGLLFSFFALVLTLYAVEIYGVEVEANPIMKPVLVLGAPYTIAVWGFAWINIYIFCKKIQSYKSHFLVFGVFAVDFINNLLFVF